MPRRQCGCHVGGVTNFDRSLAPPQSTTPSSARTAPCRYAPSSQNGVMPSDGSSVAWNWPCSGASGGVALWFPVAQSLRCSSIPGTPGGFDVPS